MFQLVICKKQLAEANEQVQDTKDRLRQVQETHKTTTKDLIKLQEEVSLKYGDTGNEIFPGKYYM